MKDASAHFTTHEEYRARLEEQAELYSRRGWLLFAACDEGASLAQNVLREYNSMLRQKVPHGKQIIEIPLMKDIFHYFEDNGKDGSIVKLPGPVGGADAFVFQNCMDKRLSRNSIDANVMQLYKTVRSLNEFDAAHITAIVPYFPYSRQDRPSFMEREVAFAQEMIRLLKFAGADRVVCYHPHSTSPQFKFISGLDLYVEVFDGFRGDSRASVGSIDRGGLKENKTLAQELGLPFIPSLKDRDDKVKTESLGLESDIDGRDIMIATDDETATFSSAMGLMKKAAAQGVKEFHLGISHLRLSPEHVDMLKKAHEVYGMRMLHTTDSIPQRDEIIGLPFVKVHSLAQRWAIYINKVHFYESASDVFFNPKRRK